jgi:hypothetical protein
VEKARRVVCVACYYQSCKDEEKGTYNFLILDNIPQARSNPGWLGIGANRFTVFSFSFCF